MHCLKIDFSKCEDCFKCEELLPKFRTVYDGYLLVSDNKAHEKDVVESVASVQKTCPSGAILFHEVEQAKSG